MYMPYHHEMSRTLNKLPTNAIHVNNICHAWMLLLDVPNVEDIFCSTIHNIKFQCNCYLCMHHILSFYL